MTLPFHTRETQAAFIVKETLSIPAQLSWGLSQQQKCVSIIYFYHTQDFYFFNITEKIQPNF